MFPISKQSFLFGVSFLVILLSKECLMDKVPVYVPTDYYGAPPVPTTTTTRTTTRATTRTTTRPPPPTTTTTRASLPVYYIPPSPTQTPRFQFHQSF